MALIISMSAGGAGAAEPAVPPDRTTSADIEATVEAVENFRAVAASDVSGAARAAMPVCRLAVSQAVQGVKEARNAILGYEGPGKLILSLVCQGYMQAAFDWASAIPEPKK